MHTTLERELRMFRLWMSNAVVSPRKALVIVSSDADEMVFRLSVPWFPRSAIEPTGYWEGDDRLSVRVRGRHLVVRGRRDWSREGENEPESEPVQRVSVSARLRAWLPRPFVASFVLPFDTERSQIRTRVTGDDVQIRVGRRLESTPLA